MRRLLYIPLFVAMCLLASCSERKAATVAAPQVSQNDSLQQIIQQRDNQINEMMGTLNEIQEGFHEINKAENRVNLAQEGERADMARQITEDVRFIADRMEQNRELIKRLQSQLKESDFKSAEMKKVISNMLVELDEKDKQLQQLRAELDAKNIHIAELDQTISDLSDNVSDLEDESEEKSRTITNQETQLNTAWFVFGTKQELKEQRILVDGKVLQSTFNKNYFTRIDIRVTKEIKFYSKSATLLTTHPKGSYELDQDENKQYMLRITNPQIFWSTSKYLVVLVK